ncbi:MAG: hypothetical protein JO022_22255 [Acidobacteriaceae bacterium]|nr:hypothetical protein [Acidobacteriaceae bacterium]
MIPPGWVCSQRVGYLFPHPCERSTPVGCPDCQGGQLTDPYRYRHDRYEYSKDYDDYAGDWSGVDIDFTDSDGERLVTPRETYEDDFSAS